MDARGTADGGPDACRFFDHLTETISVPASRLKLDRVNCLVGSNVVQLPEETVEHD